MDDPELWRWLWLVAAGVFALAEAATAGAFFSLPFAVGALLAAVAAFFDMAAALQWLLFAVGSGAAFAAVRPLARRLDRAALPAGVGAQRWVGKEAVVIQEIPAGTGETGMVRIEREQWRAESLTGTAIAPGSTVYVQRVDGTRLVVVPMELQ